jgi:hypothetical protein
VLRQVKSAGTPFVVLTSLLGVGFLLFLCLLAAALW